MSRFSGDFDTQNGLYLPVDKMRRMKEREIRMMADFLP